MGGLSIMKAVTSSLKPKTPDVKNTDPIKQDQDAQKLADVAANTELAEKKKKRTQNSLLSSGGERGSGSGSGGKTTLGQ